MDLTCWLHEFLHSLCTSNVSFSIKIIVYLDLFNFNFTLQVKANRTIAQLLSADLQLIFGRLISTGYCMIHGGEIINGNNF